jgi:hypothetical protein
MIAAQPGSLLIMALCLRDIVTSRAAPNGLEVVKIAVRCRNSSMLFDRLKSVCNADCDVQDVIGGEGSQSVRCNFLSGLA